MIQSISLIPEASAIRRGFAGMLTAPRRVLTVRVSAPADASTGWAVCPDEDDERLQLPSAKGSKVRQKPRMITENFIVSLQNKGCVIKI
jgi:hypothetical protein